MKGLQNKLLRTLGYEEGCPSQSLHTPNRPKSPRFSSPSSRPAAAVADLPPLPRLARLDPALRGLRKLRALGFGFREPPHKEVGNTS